MSTIDGRRARGQATRRTILDATVRVGSLEGLEALTIGRLAGDLGISKSGLFAHFGSKEELQLATVDHAREVFIGDVIAPAKDAAPGLARLWALCDGWIGYMERETFPGGCFFAQASVEFDNRPGPVRDRVVEVLSEWRVALAATVRRAQEAGQLRDAVEPEQFVFEIDALVLGANWSFQLYRDPAVFVRARRGIARRLAELAADDLPEPVATLASAR